ncbi:hypothetical protein ACQVBX_05655 [Dyella sp. KULCS107]|uniref:hypothetical protein n=1 Tax=Dyella sp. KULCS107 TaxID=3422216 RepID=UPI003D6EABB1
MVKHLAAKKLLIGLAVATACAIPLGASAHDHRDHGDRYQHDWQHGDRGDWHADHRDWHGDRDEWRGDGDRWRRDHDRDGDRWIAGAIVAGLIDGAVAPAPRYYEAPPTVVYRRPTRVIYEDSPVVTRTVVYGRRYDDDDGD